MKTTVYVSSLLMVSLCSTTLLASDDEKHEKYPSQIGVGAVNNESYANECGACHFAYQAGLLPSATWQTLMSKLDDHFGENAELPAETLQTLTTYLTDNAADKQPSKVYHELNKYGATTSLRISELRGFQEEHKEIPSKMVKDNPDVQSFSHCARCHRDAAEGIYDEHRVNIPGFGRWDD